MAFVAPPGHHGYHTAAESYVDANGQPQHTHHYAPNHNSAMQDAAKGAYYSTNLPPPQISCDVKPRLTKEQHDILESHFQKQNKPSTNIKKGFAESLNVSLDKVNNWFQNRRAKSKQVAKKQAGAYSIYSQQHHANASANALSFSSDSDTSPTFPPNSYYTMMQQCSGNEQMTNGLGLANMQQFEEQSHHHGLPFSADVHSGPQPFNTSQLMPQQDSRGMFDSPQDLNRRTLTQEQFDAFAQGAGMLQSPGFDPLQQDLSRDADVLQQDFSRMQEADYKQLDFAFPADLAEPPSSNDSSIPSTMSEHSMFPSSSAMQEQAAMSATSSDWADSRSSSICNANEEGSPFQPVPMQHRPQQLPPDASSQWQPGQSVPVDAKGLQQQFEDAHRQAQQYRHNVHEEPLAWPDEASAREDSQSGAVLAHQLDQFAIHTPQPPSSSTFKIPTPSAHGGDIASRRQRNRPAQLSVGVRSQSYSGAAQPASPGRQSHTMPSGQQIRKIRSYNVMNGGVAQGRVMKSTPGSAQRSPMHWTFADAISSNNASRQASIAANGNLAPPTPLSPNESSRQEQQRPKFPAWQSSSGNFSRQASISEQDAEYNVAPNSDPPKHFASPPTTPMYHHQQQQHRAFHGNGLGLTTEYTPPQSAPAVQTTFSANAFMPPPPQPAPSQTQAQPIHAQFQQASFAPPQTQSYTGQTMSGLPFQSYNSGSIPQFGISAPEAPEGHVRFAHGVPLVNEHGQLTMAYPPQMQTAQFLQRAPVQTAPQPQQYSFVTNSGASPGVHVPSPLPRQQQSAELFVHEYSPPSESRRGATPRKANFEAGPKYYTFANQGPEHFEKDKAKKGDAKSSTTSSSPASASPCS